MITLLYVNQQATTAYRFIQFLLVSLTRYCNGCFSALQVNFPSGSRTVQRLEGRRGSVEADLDKQLDTDENSNEAEGNQYREVAGLRLLTGFTPDYISNQPEGAIVSSPLRGSQIQSFNNGRRKDCLKNPCFRPLTR